MFWVHTKRERGTAVIFFCHGYRLRFLSLWRWREISASISSRISAHSFPSHALCASFATHARIRLETRTGGSVSPNLVFFMPRMYNGVLHLRNKKTAIPRIFCKICRFYWVETLSILQEKLAIMAYICYFAGQ